MSADVQPRKRKDKKRKRDSLDSKSEVEITVGKISLKEDEDVKESHHGVHATKMGADDVHLHVQADHSTGGHWFAKIFFFSLLAILLGLIGLIINENRGLSDLDTPLSESRFSEYFDGWVDEHRQSHDDHHDKIPAELEDHDAEPFEEEEDHSELDEEEEHDGHDAHDEHEDHEVEHDDQEEEAEDDSEDADEVEKEQSEEVAEDENQEVVNDDDEEDDENEEDEAEDEVQRAEEYLYTRNKREVNEEPEDDEDEGFGDTEEPVEPNDDADDDDNAENPAPSTEVPELNHEDDPYDEVKKNYNQSTLKEQVDELYDMYEQISSALSNNQTDNTAKLSQNVGEKATVSKFLQKTTDDDDFESLENVVDNDADEQLHLEQKAKREKEHSPSTQVQEEEEPESSSVTLKVFVGVALAFVARLVLIKKDTSKHEDPAVSMRRRLTMVSAEEPIPPDDEEPDDIEEECIDEEEEEEEEEVVEYSEEEVVIEKYVPETFEQLSAMFRTKESEYTKSSGIEELRAKMEDIKPKIEEAQPKIQEIKQAIEEMKPKIEDIASKKEIPKISEETKSPPIVTESPVPSPIKSPDPVREDVRKETLVKSGSDEAYEGEDVEELSEGEEEEEIDEVELDSEEEEISDIDEDDDDLMKRLEEKYGKLPERQYDSEEEEDNSWTKIQSRQGGGPQSYSEDELIEEELRRANEEMLQNNLQSALRIFESLSLKYPDIPGALYGKAKALDRLSDEYKSNQILLESIWAYKRFLALDEKIDDTLYLEAAKRCIDRMRFRGLNLQAVPIHQSLIKRFPDDPSQRNELTVTYLLINRFAEAKTVLNETLLRWPNDGFAQVHYGFVVKNLDKDLETAVNFLWKGIKSEQEGTQDGRFYFNLGDALQRLGRVKEARHVFQEGAKKKLFPSEFQRSLYNVENLKAQPFWTKQEIGYETFLDQLEKNWEIIRDEGLGALNQKGFFVDEAEGLRDFGDWKQFELFSIGQKNTKNCAKAPVTCAIIEMFPAARFCKRGQTKFSVMHPNTHVWPHCGPTNCRIRAHLGLKVPPGTKLRVAQEEKTWEEGKFLIFDDSFEHEVWHSGTSLRLVLIVDVWHPELTEEQRNVLTPI